MKLTDIVGLEEKHAQLLAKAGIREVEDLLPLTAYQIKQLARSIGVSVRTLDTWQEHADLMRIEGVDPKIANALNLIGIDSVKEFARRNPKSVLERLKQLKSERSNILPKIPAIKNVESWIKKAKELIGAPKKPTPEEEPVPTPEIPKIPDYKPIEVFEKDYGEYGPGYWENKWEKAPIIYTGRALRGESYKKQIDADVKTFIKKDDAILWHVITQVGLRRDTPNETAFVIQNFVCNFLKYKYDEETEDCPEFWQFPFEAIQSEIGDCEDGAILIASLLINAGIPSWRVKVCAAQVMADPVFAPSDTELGGHAYCIYLADRPDDPRGLAWIVLDWCYLPDSDVPIEEKPLARDGGQQGAYKEILFTFNDENSWAQNSLAIIDGRISKNRQATKDEVIAPLEDVLKHLAGEQLEKVFRKFGIDIE
ncbi:MAG: DUF4332 domain-containing protein [Candidatus Hodarchaeota archaeon]